MKEKNLDYYLCLIFVFCVGIVACLVFSFPLSFLYSIASGFNFETSYGHCFFVLFLGVTLFFVWGFYTKKIWVEYEKK